MNNPPPEPSPSWRTQVESRLGSSVAGRYRLQGVLACGGFGAVFRAVDAASGRHVALKLMFLETEGFPVLAERMEREGRLGLVLDHPNIVKGLGFGEAEDGCRYVVTELIEGRTLRDLMNDGPLAAARAVELMVELCAALAACHARGVIHRDLKPRNIMIDERHGGRLKLIDFGLAKVAPGMLEMRSPSSPEADDAFTAKHAITKGDLVFGTLAYMAPETALGMSAVDARSDLYAMGVVFYELVAGKHPFDASDPADFFRQHRTITPPSFAERAPEVHVPPWLEHIVMRLLQKQPDDRYASVDEVRDALRGPAIEQPPSNAPTPTPPEASATEPSSSPLSKRTAIALVVAVALALVFALVGDRGRDAPETPSPARSTTWTIDSARLRPAAPSAAPSSRHAR